VNDVRLVRFREFWETLSADSLARLPLIYADDAYFRDPFNEVRGVHAIRALLEEMFARIEQPTFEILEVVQQGDSAFLVWNFDFRIRILQPRRLRRIHGTSHVRFDANGRVVWHRDYWDAAGELYMQLPVIGRLMRWLGSIPPAKPKG
jgi:steroid delta-isomerase